MRKSIQQIKVYTTEDGEIHIEQGNDRDGSLSIVTVSPEQIDLLCKWLQEAKESVLNNPRNPVVMHFYGNLSHIPYTRKVGMNPQKPVYG